MKNKTLTIKDIATMADVSVSTVSRVLNKKDRVNKETQKKVEKIISEYDYKPNHLAVSMIKKSFKTIYIMVPNCHNLFYAQVIHGAEDICRQRGYNLLIYTSNDRIEDEVAFFNNSFTSIADGLISIPVSMETDHYKNYTKPIVTVDRYLDIFQTDSVVVDNVGGTELLVEHLIKKGHKNIAYIGSKPDSTVARDRLNGYQQAMFNNNLPLYPENVYLKDWTIEFGKEVIPKIYGRNDKNKPTAVICANSAICVGALLNTKSLNISCPAELELVSFDDCDIARYTDMTALDRPTVEMGEIAAQFILDRIENKIATKIPQRITLPVSLICRD